MNRLNLKRAPERRRILSIPMSRENIVVLECFGDPVLEFRQMPVHVIVNSIADKRRASLTEDAVKAAIGDRPGEYEIRVALRQNSFVFCIQVDGPDGTITHSFEQLKDCNSIRLYFDRAIPRTVPVAVKVLCDECVKMGLMVRSMKECLLSDGPNSVYRYGCRFHDRAYEEGIGYFSPNDGMSTDLRLRTRLCPLCATAMYIEFAESGKLVRFRCPNVKCYHYESGSL